MALKGNLRDFTVAQLFNLINLAKKTGTLVIEGPGEEARVNFRDGKLAYAQLTSEDSSLSAILQRNKKISRNQYVILQQQAAKMTDKELGLLLVNAGYLSQDDILGSLQQYFINIVRRLFTWVEGLFRFEPDKPPPEERIPVRIDLENLIIEGSRQLREWEQLQDEIPSLEMLLKFAERPGANMRKLNLSVEEWRTVKFINGQNSIKQIAAATKMNDLEIRRVVFALLQAGVVELIRPKGMPLIGITNRVSTPQEKEQQVSLVNRLINRIRSV
jgi:hypothetical protein